MQFSNLNLAEYDGLTEQVGQVDNVEFLKSKINLFMGWSPLLPRAYCFIGIDRIESVWLCFTSDFQACMVTSLPCVFMACLCQGMPSLDDHQLLSIHQSNWVATSLGVRGVCLLGQMGRISLQEEAC
ncbi:hypothetical protein MANES_18G080750v8 [Manihot esculenta]|uniref:Uncharacterized protein n=1 Tax=Manihot esculenta TaxID=3983 RepID=A0ACB7FZW6_MANES|nr:hypothetical protein MANES_18G080750v8 [Manihot esculenta]